VPTCSNDLGKDLRIYLYSIILSIFTFFLVLLPFYDFLNNSLGFTIPIWVETPSIIGLYAMYVSIFDKYLWKYQFIKWLGLPKIPNLNGSWKANLESSFDATQKEADVTICQSYSKFSMVLKTDESTSTTMMAAFEVANPILRALTYTFLCKPLPTSSASMNIHEGTCHLEIFEGDKKMKGYYYSGRGRQNFGEICLKKVATKSE
jgi:hypothetical protein